MIKYSLILATFLCIAISAKAQDSLYVLTDTVLVTADRLEQHIFDINSSIAVLSSKEIEIHSPRSTPEALITTPGVFVQKTNHGGGSPFLRGLTGQQSLILVDGIRLNNSITRSGPNQYFNTVDVRTLKRVEVLKGAGSVEYGSDAIGGTINLITDKPRFSFDDNFYFTPEIDASYMSNDMEKSASAKLRGGNKSIAFLGTFSYADFGDIKAGNGTGIQSPNGYDQVSAAFDLMFRTSANSSLLISTQFLNQNEVPIFHKVDLEDYEYNYFDPQMRSLTYLRFSSVNPGNDLMNKLFSDYQLTAFYNMTEEGRISKKNESLVKRDENDKLSAMELLPRPAQFWLIIGQ
jgi:hemoglobin/transferrin/lactoferrin receptor protein